jgi:hypothetical protein
MDQKCRTRKAMATEANMTRSDRFPSPQPNPAENKQSGSRGSSERPVRSKAREQALDQTIADSFPTSDPPSSIPDPSNETEELPVSAAYEPLTQGLPPGSWAAISIEQRRVVGTGATPEAAIDKARRAGHSNVSVVRVAENPEAPGQFRDRAS